MRISYEKRYVLNDLDEKIAKAKLANEKFGHLSKIKKYFEELWSKPEKKVRYRTKILYRQPERIPGHVDMNKVNEYLYKRGLWPLK